MAAHFSLAGHQCIVALTGLQPFVKSIHFAIEKVAAGAGCTSAGGNFCQKIEP